MDVNSYTISLDVTRSVPSARTIARTVPARVTAYRNPLTGARDLGNQTVIVWLPHSPGSSM